MSLPPTNPVEDADLTLTARVREGLKTSPRMLPDMFWTLMNNVVSAVSGVLIFKIVSRWVAAQEYGQASLVLGIVGLLSSLIAGPVVLAHLRLYFEHSREGRGHAYSRAVLTLLLRTSAVMSGLYLLVSAAYYAFNNHVYWSLALPALLLLFVQTQLTGTLTFLEAEKRYRALTFAQSLSKVLQVPFLILLIFASIRGPAAVVSSQVLAAAAVAIVWGALSSKGSATVEQESDMSPRRIAESAARVFGWSLYLFNLFGWVIATSDRYIIEHFWSTKEVGIYALNYGLWSVPYLSLNAWLEMLVRSRIFERAEAHDWNGVRRLLRNRIALAILLGSIVTAVIYFAGQWIALGIIGEKYWHGQELMMLICTAHFFYVLAASFHVLFHALKRTQVLMWIAWVTSIVNVGANLVVVPKYGILGAAWTTFGAYGVMCVITLIVAPVMLSRAERERSHEMVS